MNKDELFDLAWRTAELAGQCLHDLEPDALRAIVEAVAAAEREACAQLCEELPGRIRASDPSEAALCAAAIRARG